jgi:hydroxyethylthiazole kinase
MFAKITEIVTQIKQDNPLILNITNDVTMDIIANGLLSLGAAPVMSKAPQEIEDLMGSTQAVVINLGTVNETFIQLCQQACLSANQLGKPIILDPVGAGASRYRTDICQQLISDYRIAIIRGNASEIMALSGLAFATKGVTSTAQSEQAIYHAQTISTNHQIAVVISGQTDIIVDGRLTNTCRRGSAWMPMVTGTGCLLSSVIATFHAVEQNRFVASLAATVFYGTCGEIAAKEASGPSTFKIKFLDALHTMPNSNQYTEA